MEEKSKFSSDREPRVISGLIVAILLIVIYVIFVVVMVAREYYYSDNISIEKLTQPLIISAATLFASALAVYSVVQNIKNQNSIYKDELERKLFAARASFPLALREIEDVCVSTISQLLGDTEIDENRSLIISDNAQETIKMLIEHSNGKVREDLSNFLMYYQIAISQFSRYKIQSINNKDLDHLYNKDTVDSIICWISLRAIAETYLQYGRRTSPSYDNEKACDLFRERFHSHKDYGRYQSISVGEFNQIFQEAVNNRYPGFLNPSYFARP